MVRDRTMFALALALALGACSPDTSGAGSGLPPMPGEGESDDPGTTTSVEATADGSASTSGATMPPADDTADGPAMDEGPVEHPAVVVSDAPSYDFGPNDLSASLEHVFTVTNIGDGEATAVQVAGVGGAFAIAGHDCGDVLAPGDACEVTVRFAPLVFGGFETELQIAYQDQGMATSAARPIMGRGVGVTGNLLINGGGEEGNAFDVPPTGWQIVYGPSWSANWFEVVPAEGSRTISAGYGPPGTNQFTLSQQVYVAPLTSWGDAGGVRFYYRAHHRAATDLNDPTAVILRFRSSGGDDLGTHPSGTVTAATWNVSEGNFVAPRGTHHVQLTLECTRDIGEWCSGFFDGVEVWAEWLG